MRISDWSSDVCSSDLNLRPGSEAAKAGLRNCDRLDYSDSTEGTMRHPDMKLTVKVTRDGKTFETSFLPRGKPMTVYQWELTSDPAALQANHCRASGQADMPRSEEHTSELQSLMRISYADFCLKKKIIGVK